MATVTPNFLWPVPTSTDLVRDGATAIEALGDSIDASLVDLKGGTTGQVLAKASGTDMDFSWVAQDDSNAIQNSIVDAKGDLISATANDTPARLAVGANGETLVADSSTSTGLRYTAGTVQANPVLNSAMQIWQRGTSISVGANVFFTADRWAAFRSGFALGETVSRQLTGDTTNLPFIQYAARVQRDSGNTSTNTLHINQPFETINSIPFAGKTVTLSLYARRGANYSSTSNALTVQLFSGTGTDQTTYGSYTGLSEVIGQTATLTTTWQRFSYTATIGATATELSTQISFTPTGTAGANDYFEVTGVQIDIGSVALPFRTYAGTIQGELAACQRYYWRLYNDTADFGAGVAASGTVNILSMNLPVTMRTKPTVLDTASLQLYDLAAGAFRSGGSFTIFVSTPNTAEIRYTHGSSVFTVNQTSLWSGSVSTSFLGLGAEL